MGIFVIEFRVVDVGVLVFVEKRVELWFCLFNFVFFIGGGVFICKKRSDIDVRYGKNYIFWWSS